MKNLHLKSLTWQLINISRSTKIAKTNKILQLYKVETFFLSQKRIKITKSYTKMKT